LVLKAKALKDVVGLGHLASTLALVLALEFAAGLRLPCGEAIGAMTRAGDLGDRRPRSLKYLGGGDGDAFIS